MIRLSHVSRARSAVTPPAATPGHDQQDEELDPRRDVAQESIESRPVHLGSRTSKAVREPLLECRSRERVGPIADQGDKAECNQQAHGRPRRHGAAPCGVPSRARDSRRRGPPQRPAARPRPRPPARASRASSLSCGAARPPEPRDGPGDQHAASGELETDHPDDRIVEPPCRPAARRDEDHARRGTRKDPFVRRVDPGPKPRKCPRDEQLDHRPAGRTRPTPARSPLRRPAPRVARPSRRRSTARPGSRPSSRSRHRSAGPSPDRRRPRSGSMIRIGKPVARQDAYCTSPAASLPRTISALVSRVVNSWVRLRRSFSSAITPATHAGTSQIVRRNWTTRPGRRRTPRTRPSPRWRSVSASGGRP